MLLALCLAFGVAEAGARRYAHRRAHDLASYRDIGSADGRAVALRRVPGVRLALVGNSVTEVGVDLPRFDREASSALGEPVHTGMFVMSGTAAPEWYFIIKRFLCAPRMDPDLIGIVFFHTNLEAESMRDVGRLASYVAGLRDVPDYWRLDPGSAPEFVASCCSTLFAMRRVTREHVLGHIPGYYRYEMARNSIAYAQAQPATDQSEGARSHHALRTLLNECRRQHLRVCFVAYPLPDRWEVNPETLRIIRDSGMLYADMRDLPGLTRADYRDGTHLRERGRQIFTAALARRLAMLAPPAPEARRRQPLVARVGSGPGPGRSLTR